MEKPYQPSLFEVEDQAKPQVLLAIDPEAVARGGRPYDSNRRFSEAAIDQGWGLIDQDPPEVSTPNPRRALTGKLALQAADAREREERYTSVQATAGTVAGLSDDTRQEQLEGWRNAKKSL